MADTTSTLEQPQLYLITPPEIDLTSFPDLLGRVLDTRPVACLRLTLSTSDEAQIARAADACREVAHARDIPLVITDHVLMVQRLGLDGVHLSDGARGVRKTRTELGSDAIIGAFCSSSSHDGLNAGENGADYISFGPIGATLLGDGEQADTELFQWWSDVVEIPVVAEGALDEANLRQLSQITDFFALGEEVWQGGDPVANLARLADAING